MQNRSLLLLLLATTPALAQTRTTCHLGVRGGLNWASTALDSDANSTQSNSRLHGYSTKNSPITAWQAGAVLEIRRGRFAFQPCLLFSQKGQSFTYAAYGNGGQSTFQDAGTVRSNWLDLPLDIVVTLHRNHGLQLLAGSYVTLAVGGYRTGTRSYTNSLSAYRAGDYHEPLSYGPSSYNRRLDAGLRAGVGYRQGPFQAQLIYSLGLTNLHQASTSPDVVYYDGADPNYPQAWYVSEYHDYQADAAYNRVWQLTGTYFLDL